MGFVGKNGLCCLENDSLIILLSHSIQKIQVQTMLRWQFTNYPDSSSACASRNDTKGIHSSGRSGRITKGEPTFFLNPIILSILQILVQTFAYFDAGTSR